MIITGKGGSGKSFVIQALVAKYGASIAVTATTGKAASSINGETLHRALHIPVQSHFNKLDGKALEELQQRFTGIRIVIVDEYSMLGAATLHHIDQRLRQATGCVNNKWGGIIFILTGDPLQLPTVNGIQLQASSLTDRISEDARKGLLLYLSITDVVQLTISHRVVAGQYQHQRLLRHLSTGGFDQADYDYVVSRHVGSSHKLPEGCTRLYPTREKVNAVNNTLLGTLSTPVAMIDAEHDCPSSTALASDKLGGLEPSLYLAEGASVMLTSNICPAHHLSNGSFGTVKKLLFRQKPPAQPSAVIVDFPDYTGPAFNSDKPTEIPIVPVQFTAASRINNKAGRFRRQIPLKLSWAMTIHKAQGQTLDKVHVDLGKKEMAVGLSYVALSRCRRGDDLSIVPCDYARLAKIQRMTGFTKKVKEYKRLQRLCQLCITIPQKRKECYRRQLMSRFIRSKTTTLSDRYVNSSVSFFWYSRHVV